MVIKISQLHLQRAVEAHHNFPHIEYLVKYKFVEFASALFHPLHNLKSLSCLDSASLSLSWLLLTRLIKCLHLKRIALQIKRLYLCLSETKVANIFINLAKQ